MVDAAGWLKTYQPDFALQAVRAYSNLTQDIKRSMRAEALVTPQNESPSTNQWMDVCTTLIADSTTFSIRRLLLRRRRRTDFGLDNALVDLGPSAFEEQFITEPVMDMDPTLTDAIERVLAQSGHSSRAASRAPSPTRSRAGSLKGSPGLNKHASSFRGVGATSNTKGASVHTAQEPPALEVPHSECKKMVLGALSEVVRSVVSEPGGSGKKARQESSLREGVRRWLGEVEEGW